MSQPSKLFCQAQDDLRAALSCLNSPRDPLQPVDLDDDGYWADISPSAKQAVKHINEAINKIRKLLKKYPA